MQNTAHFLCHNIKYRNFVSEVNTCKHLPILGRCFIDGGVLKMTFLVKKIQYSNLPRVAWENDLYYLNSQESIRSKYLLIFYKIY